jgi:hypothetical protein
MKRIPLILFAIILAFASCTKEEILPIPDNPNNNQDIATNSSVLWEYEIDQSGIILTDLVLDNKDNLYFFSSANDDIILNDSLVLLTGDYSTVVFNRLLNDQPAMQVYTNGDLTSSTSADYLGWMVTSFVDCKITSDGNLVLVSGDRIVSVDAQLSPATA